MKVTAKMVRRSYQSMSSGAGEQYSQSITVTVKDGRRAHLQAFAAGSPIANNQFFAIWPTGKFEKVDGYDQTAALIKIQQVSRDAWNVKDAVSVR